SSRSDIVRMPGGLAVLRSRRTPQPVPFTAAPGDWTPSRGNNIFGQSQRHCSNAWRARGPSQPPDSATGTVHRGARGLDALQANHNWKFMINSGYRIAERIAFV